MSSVRDTLGRPLRDLRISVTDRCNFRCPYCMPKEVFGPGYPFLKDPQLMTRAEITAMARAFRSLGVEKVRLTGGEPLMRTDLAEVVRDLKAEAGIPEVAMTTNGWILSTRVHELKAAGLDRVNLSVDSLDEATSARMNGIGVGPARILKAVDAAADAGLPVRINMVVQRGVNDGEIEAMAAYFRERGHRLRFIEYMDVGSTNGWRASQVVPAREIRDRIHARWPIEPVEPAYRGEVAARYRYVDGKGEIGIISSITEPFCRDCHRARISADGRLFTCLFATQGHDLLGVVRSGASQEALAAHLAGLWGRRADRYSDERAERLARGETASAPKVEMSFIGG